MVDDESKCDFQWKWNRSDCINNNIESNWFTNLIGNYKFDFVWFCFVLYSYLIYFPIDKTIWMGIGIHTSGARQWNRLQCCDVTLLNLSAFLRRSYASHMTFLYYVYESGWTLYIFHARKKEFDTWLSSTFTLWQRTHNGTHRALRSSVRHKLSERALGVERERKKSGKSIKFAFYAWSKTTPTTSSNRTTNKNQQYNRYFIKITIYFVNWHTFIPDNEREK